MRRTLLVLVAALFLAPGALAAQGEVDVQADLPLEFTGERQARADDAAYFVEGTRGDMDLRADVEEGQLVRVVHRAYGYVRPDRPQMEVTWRDHVERHEIDLDGGSLVLQERREGFQALVHDGAVHVEDSGPATFVGALDAPKSVESVLDTAFSLRLDPPRDDGRFHHQMAAGQHVARSDAGAATADGPHMIYLGGAVLRAQAADGETTKVRAHFRIEERPGSIYDPIEDRWTGPFTHTEYVQEHVLLQVTEGHSRLVHDGMPAHLYADRLSVATEGTALLPHAEGQVAVTDEDGTDRHELEGQDLEIGGRFTLTAQQTTPGHTRTHVTGEGDLTILRYGAVAAQYDWTTPVVMAGLGTLVLAGAAWLLSQGKTALGALAGGALAGYARVQGDDVLQHDARSQVYELVKADPGSHFQALNEKLDFGASTLNYHLRVLEKNGFLTRVKDGRYVRFFDRRSGDYSGGRKLAASALRNPTSAAIAQTIVAHPGIAQCDLASHFGLAPSTINWHVRRLHDAGLVDKRRDQHYTRYFAGDAWAGLPMEDQARHGLAVAAV